MIETRQDPVADSRAAPRKAWRRPAMTVLAARSAELAVGTGFDNADYS
jgi:hypothetical protein